MPGSGGEIRIISIESGRYISRPAIQRLANGEDIFSIDPADLLDPVVIEHEPASAEVIPLRPAITDLTDESVQEEKPTTETAEEASIEDLIETYSEIAAKAESGAEIEAETEAVPEPEPRCETLHQLQ